MNKVGQIHILVIDDNEDILSMLQAILEHKGYKTSTLDKTPQLIQTVTNLHPDIILMDKLLSGSDGCEFCKLLKADAALASIPVIMISAHPQAKIECLAAGADYFIEKPFEMDHLLQTIANAINSK
ncbi:MAG: response regulator [Ferruginibacter sp.]